MTASNNAFAFFLFRGFFHAGRGGGFGTILLIVGVVMAALLFWALARGNRQSA